MRRSFLPILFSASLLVASTAGPAPAADGWQLKVHVTAGSAARNYVVAGVQNEATDGFDAAWDVRAFLDSLESSYLYAYFPRPDWGAEAGNYAWEMQGEGAENIWPLEVMSNIAGSLTLSWPDFTALAEAGFSARLTDQSSGLTIDLAAQPSYSFENTSGAARQFELRISSPAAEEDSLGLSHEIEKNSVRLTWAAPETGEVRRYLILRKTEGSDFEPIAQVSGKRQFYLDKSAKKRVKGEGQTTFVYKIVALDRDGTEFETSGELEITLD